MNTREWLIQNYPEVSAYDFYRDLWPNGTLDDAPESYTPGKYNGIAVQIGKQGIHKYIIKDSLDNLDEILNTGDFVVISPMSYAGSSKKAEYQRYCHAIAVDLDGMVEEDKPWGIMSLLQRQAVDITHADGSLYAVNPMPTYVVSSSAHNVHLYYMLDKPIPMYKSNVESLSRYKTRLTKRLWNQYLTTQYNAVQQEPIGQDMRAVGSITKDGKGRVLAFKTGDKVSIDYLNRKPFADKDSMISVWNSPDKSKAKPRYMPKQAIPTRRPGFYEWYKANLLDYTAEGKRYFGLMCLAIIGRKCGITREEIEEDAIALVPDLDRMTENEANHFGEDDALKAITAYDVPHFVLMKRENLVRLSGVPMQKAKRNGRTIQAHITRVNAMIDFDIAMGEADVRYHGGAPTKEQVIREYVANHPYESVAQIANGCKVSRPTVYKWLKVIRADNEDRGDVCTQEVMDV